MKPLLKLTLSILFTTLVSSLSLSAKEIDIMKFTPVGSWQLREHIMTDHKGKQTYQEFRTSLIAEEKRAGVDYVWVEIVVDNYKMKKGAKGKKVGETMVMKILMERSIMKGDPSHVINNLRGLGKEIIMQTGDQEPMIIEEGGMMAGALMKAFGVEVNYQFDETGKEAVETPKGKIKCQVMEGSGTTQMRGMFGSKTVNSEVKQWLSTDVPFGIVKSVSSDDMDGKKSKMELNLLDYGKSGAVSQIKGTPQKLPGLGDLFGG
jgi:hypothetical protein